MLRQARNDGTRLVIIGRNKLSKDTHLNTELFLVETTLQNTTRHCEECSARRGNLNQVVLNTQSSEMSFQSGLKLLISNSFRFRFPDLRIFSRAIASEIVLYSSK